MAFRSLSSLPWREKFAERTGTLVFSDLGGLGKIMPFAGFAFGIATFAAIGFPGFANFAAEVMVFFGAFRVGADWQSFHIFQIATVLALWGVVISAVYMLRAYRAIFMGAAKPEALGGHGPRSFPHLASADYPAHRRDPYVRFLSQYRSTSAAADLFTRPLPRATMIPAPSLEIAVLLWG